jgi:hypothetical protein
VISAIPIFSDIPKKMTLIFVFWQQFWDFMSQNKGQKTARFKGLYKPIGEVQICRILSNRAIFERILHKNRKEGFYGVFRIGV